MIVEVQITYANGRQKPQWRGGYSRRVDLQNPEAARLEEFIHQTVTAVEGRHGFRARIFNPDKPRYEGTLAWERFNKTPTLETRLHKWILDKLQPFLFQAAVEAPHG